MTKAQQQIKNKPENASYEGTKAGAPLTETQKKPNKTSNHASSLPQVSDANQETQEFDPVLVEALQGKYTLEKVIGQGSQGKIYKGTCVADGKPVAIKQLRVTSTENWKQYELFDREAKVLASLDLPGTAKFYEAIQNLEGPNPISVIVQEFIPGRSLQTYINNGDRFLFEHVCQILIKILDILQSLHQHNPQVVHRDIKPSNIILTYPDNPTEIIPGIHIVDFGAVANPQVQDGGSTVTGTYGYMAPEQLIGKPTAASDIYAFAVMAVYLFSGTPPENIATQDLRLLIDPHLEHLPHEVTIFLRLMLDTAPTKRLMDYDKIRDTLHQFSKHQFKIDYLLQYAKENPGKETNYKIDHIQSIGQAGNFTLWQDLDESTPRNIHPIYKRLLNIDDAYFSKNNNLINISNRNTYFQRDKLELKQKFNKQLYYRFLIPATIFLSVIPFISMQMKVIQPKACVCIISLALILFIAITFIFVKKSKVYKQIANVLKYGRKSIATIESVEYISGETMMNRVSLNSADRYKLGADENNRLNNTIRPIWKVTYAFNPPDDKSPDALHHVYYSDVPIDHLKAGDALPILYLIHPDMLHTPSGSIINFFKSSVSTIKRMNRSYKTFLSKLFKNKIIELYGMLDETAIDEYQWKQQTKCQKEKERAMQSVLSMPYPLPKDSSFAQCPNLLTPTIDTLGVEVFEREMS